MVNTKIRLIIFSVVEHVETLNSQQKQDLEITMAQIMNSLLQNSDDNVLMFPKNYFSLTLRPQSLD